MIRRIQDVFVLDTNNTTYAFRVTEIGYLEHLYYGRKIRIEEDTCAGLIEKHEFAPGNNNTYDGEKTMVMSLIAQLLAGQKPGLTKGEQIWDYLYADDVADAFMLLAQKGKDGGIYPIGSGDPRPLREYIEIIRDAIDPALPLGFGEVPYGDKQVMYLCADISKLREDTGFVPHINFKDGVFRTIEFVKNSCKA